MLKFLLNIVCIVFGMGLSVHAADFQLIQGDLECYEISKASDEVSPVTSTQHLFFDHKEDYSVSNNTDIEPALTNENFLEGFSSIYRKGLILSNLHHTQFVRAAGCHISYSYLKKTLYPFHSFW